MAPQRRREAEFKQREDAAAAAYHEVKYDEVHAANAELHAKIEAMAVPTTTVHTNAAPQATSHDHVKRKIKKHALLLSDSKPLSFACLSATSDTYFGT